MIKVQYYIDNHYCPQLYFMPSWWWPI